MVFDAQLTLPTTFALAIELRTQSVSHLLKGLRLYPAAPLKGTGLQVFELLVGHGGFLLTYFYLLAPYSRKKSTIVEQDHRSIKRIVKPMMGFKSFHTARRTLRGMEAMSMIRKGQVNGISQGDSVSQAKFIEALFGVSA